MRRAKIAFSLTKIITGLMMVCLSRAPAQGASIPRLEVAPAQAMVGDPVKIVLRGFPSNQAVIVRVCASNLFGRGWESRAEFLTDRRGRVEVATQAPRSGTYRKADADGLFWSMAQAIGQKVTPDFTRDKLDPADFQLTADVNGQRVARAQFRRLFVAPGVERIFVHDGPLRGALFVPYGKGPHPAVIVLSGSEGGLRERPAAYLASQGYAAMALAYFGFDDLPPALEKIPLEYFETALRWLQARPEIRRHGIAVLGSSRGGELALLLGATFPQINAVVADMPSGVVWAGGVDAQGNDQPAWTYRGQPLVFLSNRNLEPDQKQLAERILKTQPLDVSLLYRMALEHRAAAERARIAVEQIRGPVLLISGRDDRMWPSTLMADQVLTSLRQAKHRYPDQHLAYANVGHFIPLPGLPATVHTVPSPPLEIALGGESEPTAAAAVDSWKRTIQFLRATFR